MSKIFRVTVASALVAGVAALTPLSAQAKNDPDLPSDGSTISVPSCASAAAQAATGTITGSLASGLKFAVRVPAAAVTPATAFETRARVFTVDAAGKKSFATKKARISNVSDLGSGQVAANQHIWRLDVTDLNAEAAGRPALAFTSAGFVNCD
jgi:hypothetical protein